MCIKKPPKGGNLNSNKNEYYSYFHPIFTLINDSYAQDHPFLLQKVDYNMEDKLTVYRHSKFVIFRFFE